MNTAGVLDRYMPELVRLDNDDKIAIIENLLISMKGGSTPSPKRPDISTLFSGDWENDIPAGKLADQYCASRYYNRPYQGQAVCEASLSGL